jgi:hypothetical protein
MMFTCATEKPGKTFDELINVPRKNKQALNAASWKEKSKNPAINFNLN